MNGAKKGRGVHGCAVVDAVMASDEEKSLNHPVTVEKREEGSPSGEVAVSESRSWWRVVGHIM